MSRSRLPPPHKVVAGHRYVQAEAFSLLPTDALATLVAAETLVQVARGERYNVARFENSSGRVTLLHYPSFFEDAFPALHESWHVDLGTGRVSYRTYRDSLTPPILHRKELMLPVEHPRRPEFEALTRSAEEIGLFDEPTRIGFREHWLRLVREKGYQIVGHELIPLANDESIEPSDETAISATVARHLTALVRYGFSAPIQALARYGFISPVNEVFDYGCGRGDDIRGLLENGIAAFGWDPYYASDEPKREADVVNLGFVINVIEDPNERTEALRNA